jgi:ABC-type polysaccharide/polyol phosphate transport system ATPase subunit
MSTIPPNTSTPRKSTPGTSNPGTSNPSTAPPNPTNQGTAAVKPPISVNNVHKEFILGSSAIASLKTAVLWWRKRRKPLHINVLKGITFDVNAGECVAIIGRNGAGKSTLLSLIAKIYKPTKGTIQTHGRIAPLLELGAGFHPDLTGVENVEFNAVMLGLTRKQVKERFDEIVAFSEIGEHIYAPVRTYSSGMLARLGFAVAIHVDAETLIVDEVLSVGDFEFTKKCQERLKQFKENGGTILLVSHSHETVLDFADRAIWIQQGLIEMEGDPKTVYDHYLKRSQSDLATH